MRALDERNGRASERASVARLITSCSVEGQKDEGEANRVEMEVNSAWKALGRCSKRDTMRRTGIQIQQNKVNEKGKRLGMTWLNYALMTVFFWGVYGVLLHMGRGFMPMGAETPNAGLKAFLLVCVAYAIIGVIAYAVLKGRGSDMSFGTNGITWSLIAGIAGAAGAFTLVLSLGAAGSIYKAAAAGAVMPIVFGGAPIVNALINVVKAPPAGGMKDIPLAFFAGIVLAVTGAVLVARNAPVAAAGAHGPAPAAKAADAPAAK